MSPLDARLLNFVFGTGFAGAGAAAAAAGTAEASGAATAAAAATGASAEPPAAAAAPASPEDMRGPAASDAMLGVAVASAPVPPESCEPGLGFATAVSAVPGLFLVDLGG